MRLPYNILLLLPLVHAYPNRAGTCIGGQAAVAGFHTWSNKTVKSGPVLSLFDVYLDGVALSSDHVIAAETGVDYELQIQIKLSRRRLRWMKDPLQSSQTSFQGMLLRAEATNGDDLSDAFSPGDNLQFEETCEAPVVGLSHTSARAKTSSKVTLRIDNPTTVTLDITITTRSSAEHSIFYYSNFIIEFDDSRAIDDSKLSSNAPSLAATAATMAVSDVPSDAPSDVPSVAATVDVILTAAPTACGSATDNLRSCLQADLQDGDACDACVASALQNLTGSECIAYESGACLAISACPCGTCRDELQYFINCATAATNGCLIDCDLDLLAPTITPSVAVPTVTLVPYPTVLSTSQPTGGDACAAAEFNLAHCLTNNLDTVAGEECDRCMALAIVNTTVGCDSLESAVCSALETCPCGSCTDELTEYLKCKVGPSTGCNFGECPGVSVPTIAPTLINTAAPRGPQGICNSAQKTLLQCFQTLPDSTSCDACVANVIPQESTPCDVLQSMVCDAIDTCPCDVCAPDVEVFLSCTLDRAIGCAISCN